MKENKDWIQTYSGLKFYPLVPAGAILIRDIAHALAMQCRYGGHSLWHYSVAQHSVLVSQIVPPSMALSGLLHDASEAYLVDLPRPVKHSRYLDGYREIEERLEEQIAKAFELPYPFPQEVKEADLEVYYSEARALFTKVHPDWEIPIPKVNIEIATLNPYEAEVLFLDRFKELTNNLDK